MYFLVVNILQHVEIFKKHLFDVGDIHPTVTELVCAIYRIALCELYILLTLNSWLNVIYNICMNL